MDIQAQSLTDVLGAPTSPCLVAATEDTPLIMVKVIAGDLFQFFSVHEQALFNFEKWWSTQQPGQHMYTLDLALDLLQHSPHNPGGPPSSRVKTVDYINAMKRLLEIVHHPFGQGTPTLEVDVFHKLAQVQDVLGLRQIYLDAFYNSMCHFEHSCRGELYVIRVFKGVWEKTLSICLCLGWRELYWRLAARLVFVCSIRIDTSGDRLLYPLAGGDSGSLDGGICGRQTIDVIVAARRKVLR
ncbi:hypothetical protein B0T25DRAFT_542468 [Lasiosphaeria hispida]|uniref:Uncharacterized protein n=1 Tax=Lasiosphaeria hispida TaxID=260671 RepID=A0AAJ0ME06_9PEZI|nr:hypothetical protein B0T25DRAFT_542468 [Lasiosphaeria hispida]